MSDDPAGSAGRPPVLTELVDARRNLALAASAWAGASLAPTVPIVPGVLLGGLVGSVALVTVGTRHWARWCAVILLVTAVLGDRALEGLDPGPDGPVRGVAELVTDPEPTADGRVRVEVRFAGKRLLAETRSPAAVDALAPRLAGDRIVLSGRRARFDEAEEWRVGRHLAGRLQIDAVGSVAAPSPPAAVANRFRRLLDDGAASLTGEARALLAGLTLGDDRAQPPALAADFRAAGLTHLLAVSGQNVVFLLTVLGPALRRLRLWPRFLLAVAAVVAFAFVTRFEPSVIRAAGVAVVAIGARTIGRPSGGVRHLPLAVAALLVVDPLLTRSVGFRLSVAACAGVLLLAPAIVPRLPGPRWFAQGLGVTIGAQLAVAPVLVPTFGPMPLAALPANVVAGPIAAFLMVWGLGAGTAAGVLGGTAAWVLHRPSAVALALLDGVAAAGASLPLGSVDLRHLAVVAAAAFAWSLRRPAVRVAAAVMVSCALVSPVVQPVPEGAIPSGWAATVWVDGPAAVVDLRPGASAVDVLTVIRRHRVARVGAVVARADRPELSRVVAAIRSRVPVEAVFVPLDPVHVTGLTPRLGVPIRVAGLSVVAERVTPTLRVRIGPVSHPPPN